MTDLLVPYSIPYICQFASPDLVHDFVHGERDPQTDPRWLEYGAVSPQEYAHWAWRSCGVVCVKMAVDGITAQPSGPVMDWVQAGLKLDGYLTELRPDRPDQPVEKGWKHLALAQLAIDRGCWAELAGDLSLADLARIIQTGKVIIASVSAELGEDGPLTRNSGHLVVVWGVELKGRDVTHVIIHNPSGRTTALQAGARILAMRFMQGFSGRGIIIGPRAAWPREGNMEVPPKDKR